LNLIYPTETGFREFELFAEDSVFGDSALLKEMKHSVSFSKL